MNATQWQLLEQAERKLYKHGGLGITDVHTPGDNTDVDAMLDAMWSHTDVMVDSLVGASVDLEALVAERVAKALAVMAFGQEVGADDQ